MTRDTEHPDDGDLEVVELQVDGGRLTVEGRNKDAVDEAVDAFERSRLRDARKRQLWGDIGPGSMTRLCRAFPSLRDCPGTDPWDVNAFLKWLCTSPAVTTGSECAGRFVLQVWNSSTDWEAAARELGFLGEKDRLAPFNVVEAMARLDPSHTTALRLWLELPFWP